ncbi:hypothetical protein [Microbacterium sp. NPDC087592]|uniref:hypothetical protein n=1 Tax=Microbacterium sp. NPDC087592 TaxID=3364193 RepID=UPI0037FA0DCD
MPSATEAEELRVLQRKAYGRSGMLTEAESQRLRALEDSHRSSSAVVPPERREPGGDGEPTSREQTERAIGIVEQELAAPTESDAADVPAVTHMQDAPDPQARETPATTARGVTRRRAMMTSVAASAVLLAIGVGVGWGLFAPRAASIPLTQEQLQRRGELATEAFDPGSIRAVAQDEDALVWYATKDEGSDACLILDVGVQSQTNCLAAEETERGLSTSLTLPGDTGSDTIHATMLLSTAGEPLVAIQRWGGIDSLLAQFPEEVRDRAESLTTEGFELGLSMVGTFRNAPVWLGDRLSDAGATERCLIVDAAGPVVCKPSETAFAEGLTVKLETVDPSGARVSTAALDLQFTGQLTPYLSVSVESAVPGVENDPVVIQVSPGEQIEVEDPSDGG